MKALGFRQHGDINVMEILQVPIPEIGANEILLEVKASALNHLDIWVRQGWPGLKLTLPHISGSDAAGVIAKVGAKVKHLQPGQRVVIYPGINLWEDEFTLTGQHSVSPGFRIIGEDLPGMHAEYAAVPAKNCLLLPDQITFEAAVAVNLVGITAWRMLVKQAQMCLNQRVLILGAGGGVNSIAIQLAKLAGCQVYAITSSTEKMTKAKELGADIVLNYCENLTWAKDLTALTNKQGFDIVVDNVGKSTLSDSIKLVKRGGKIVTVGNTSGAITDIDLRYFFSKQISLVGSTVGNQNDHIQIMNLLFQNKIKPVIHTTLPLEKGIQAMQLLAQGEQFGKLILVTYPQQV